MEEPGCPRGWGWLVLREPNWRWGKLLPLCREGLETRHKQGQQKQADMNPHALTPSNPGPRPFLIPNGDFHLSLELPKDVGYAARLSCRGRW